MPETYALVIGVEQYADMNIHDVKYANRDANLFFRTITEAPTNNVSIKNATLLVGENATHQNVYLELDKIGQRIQQTDSLMLFFAGHGDIGPTGGFLLPHDFSCDKSLVSSAISFASIQSYLEAWKPRNWFIFLDSCHSGAAINAINPNVRGILKNRHMLFDNFVRKLGDDGAYDTGSDNSMTRVVISACLDDELARSSDELKQGIFTYYLARGLVCEADINNDGKLDCDDLFRYLSDSIADFCRTRKTRQSPIKSGTTSGVVYLPCWNRVISSVSNNKHKKRYLKKDSEITKNFIKFLTDTDKNNQEKKTTKQIGTSKPKTEERSTAKQQDWMDKNRKKFGLYCLRAGLVLIGFGIYPFTLFKENMVDGVIPHILIFINILIIIATAFSTNLFSKYKHGLDVDNIEAIYKVCGALLVVAILGAYPFYTLVYDHNDGIILYLKHIWCYIVFSISAFGTCVFILEG
jgi:hypothetical protein